jgi:hypothetical protein
MEYFYSNKYADENEYEGEEETEELEEDDEFAVDRSRVVDMEDDFASMQRDAAAASAGYADYTTTKGSDLYDDKVGDDEYDDDEYDEEGGYQFSNEVTFAGDDDYDEEDEEDDDAYGTIGETMYDPAPELNTFAIENPTPIPPTKITTDWEGEIAGFNDNDSTGVIVAFSVLMVALVFAIRRRSYSKSKTSYVMTSSPPLKRDLAV